MDGWVDALLFVTYDLMFLFFDLVLLLTCWLLVVYYHLLCMGFAAFLTQFIAFNVHDVYTHVCVVLEDFWYVDVWCCLN